LEFAPRTVDEVIEAMRWALAAGEAFEVIGRRSKRALGRPVSAPNLLDVSSLSGIVSYEPAELVLTARAGTPLQIIEDALAESAQCLAFEPPNLTTLLAAGHVPDKSPVSLAGSLGGVVATGLSGPRRFKAGAVRDHVLGIAGVSGRGEAFVGGGKVVKNVTGYDIPKLMTGSYGTLAVLTEITVKVLPAPADACTLTIADLDVKDAARAMTHALQSTLDVSGACHLPAGIAATGKPLDGTVTAFRLEGFRASVASRLESLRAQLASIGPLSVLEREASSAFWRAVRDVEPFIDAASGAVWRISVPPAEGAAVVERIARRLPDAKMFLDWGGGLIWMALPRENASHGEASSNSVATASTHVREALGAAGGHATLFRASALTRANVDVFQPQPAALAALSKRVKAQFDPNGVLNPGRMRAGV
jgi:glycolate oxidase FAD binding subunit